MTYEEMRFIRRYRVARMHWIEYLQLQVSIRKRATYYRAFSQKMACKDKTFVSHYLLGSFMKIPYGVATVSRID